MPQYTYPATIVSVHDGDTLTADLLLPVRTVHKDVDLGFHLRIDHGRFIFRLNFRLYGCNAAELHTPAGDAAAANLQKLLPPDTHVIVHSHKPLVPVPADKYGDRWDADVTLPDGTDLVTQLAEEQWVALWDGSGPKPVPPWPRTVARRG